MSNERRNWCPASGSEDEFVWLLNSDEVRCVECHRYLHLTKRLTLPKHVSHLVTPREDGGMGEHIWVRTIPTDGQWCNRCGLPQAQWSGEPCSGEGAAEAVEARLVARIKVLQAEVALLSAPARNDR
jgi:hypothetical protein